MMRRASEAVVQATSFQKYVHISSLNCPRTFTSHGPASTDLAPFHNPLDTCVAVLIGASLRPHRARLHHGHNQNINLFPPWDSLGLSFYVVDRRHQPHPLSRGMRSRSTCTASGTAKEWLQISEELTF